MSHCEVWQQQEGPAGISLWGLLINMLSLVYVHTETSQIFLGASSTNLESLLVAWLPHGDDNFQEDALPRTNLANNPVNPILV